ncbi:hypothetical protein C8J57DRAFT_1274838 [Mycena rebaudengoi]|nr:hypothetical protein C8J57DRAFT_1274838 [Mycena rebaudengoi]
MPSLPTFGANTTAEEVADVLPTKLRERMIFSTVLITGTSLNGIGFETARVIAKYANLVIITGYNDERLKLSEDALKKEFISANIRRLRLDLSSLAAVRKSAAEVNVYPEPIHIIIHNAAAQIAPFKLTVDSLENQIATGHIGPFLFTKLIAPKILDTKTAKFTPRVVVASEAHKLFNAPGVDLEFFENPEASKGETYNLYQQAKSANILFALELSKRSKGGLRAYSLHPGLILTNLNLADYSNQMLRGAGMINKDGNTVDNELGAWKTIPQGAATAGVPQHSSDPVIAAKLWELTEKILGEKFTFRS